MPDLLASTGDLEVRLGRTLTVLESARAEALLADSSAAARAYTGQQFTADTVTARLRVRDGRVRLPQRPATDVTGVDDTDGNTLGFTWHNGPLVAVTDAEGAWVDVTYSYGYDEIPEDIVAVVCGMAGRAFGVSADQGGLASETIGNYSYSVGAAAAAGGVGLLNDEKAVLDRYRQPGGMARIGP